jgi:glycosyltransferase involved in cell wall biosynthesis
MRIAIVTPVLNEAHHAESWAATTADADYRLWLDTGSDDDTEIKARQAGIMTAKAHIEPFRFDVARNTAMALVPEDIDLVMQLDADEILSPDWRQQLEKNPGHKRYSYRLINGNSGGWGTVVRANVCARSGFTWRYPVHEALVGGPSTCDIPDLVVTHLPENAKPRKQYLDLLRLGVREDPTGDRMCFYLARELVYQGQWEQARKEFVRHLSLPTARWPAERCESYRLIASIDTYPEPWLLRAIAECPERREPWVDLARLYLKEDRRQEAAGMVVRAERCTKEALYTTQAYAWHQPFETLKKQLFGESGEAV